MKFPYGYVHVIRFSNISNIYLVWIICEKKGIPELNFKQNTYHDKNGERVIAKNITGNFFL